MLMRIVIVIKAILKISETYFRYGRGHRMIPILSHMLSCYIGEILSNCRELQIHIKMDVITCRNPLNSGNRYKAFLFGNDRPWKYYQLKTSLLTTKLKKK